MTVDTVVKIVKEAIGLDPGANFAIQDQGLVLLKLDPGPADFNVINRVYLRLLASLVKGDARDAKPLSPARAMNIHAGLKQPQHSDAFTHPDFVGATRLQDRYIIDRSRSA
ncbi:MAG: hypothetical protein Q6370_024800 [Candidatus Sigynarchaeota archaeon]